MVKGEYMENKELMKCLNTIYDISDEMKVIANIEMNESIMLLNKGFLTDNLEKMIYIIESSRDNIISISNDLMDIN